MKCNILKTFGAQSIGQPFQSPTSKGCFVVEVTNKTAPTYLLYFHLQTWHRSYITEAITYFFTLIISKKKT